MTTRENFDFWPDTFMVTASGPCVASAFGVSLMGGPERGSTMSFYLTREQLEAVMAALTPLLAGAPTLETQKDAT